MRTLPNAIALVPQITGDGPDEIWVAVDKGCIQFRIREGGLETGFQMDRETSDDFVRALAKIHRKSVKRFERAFAPLIGEIGPEFVEVDPE